MVSFDPDAVTICCSFVPANWPRMAWVMADGAWMVSEYINRDEVVAMMAGWRWRGEQEAQQAAASRE